MFEIRPLIEKNHILIENVFSVYALVACGYFVLLLFSVDFRLFQYVNDNLLGLNDLVLFLVAITTPLLIIVVSGYYISSEDLRWLIPGTYAVISLLFTLLTALQYGFGGYPPNMLFLPREISFYGLFINPVVLFVISKGPKTKQISSNETLV